MKRIAFIFIFICWINCCLGQPLTSKVEERFELTSIVCRLAGAEEYTKCKVPVYADKIDDYFKPTVNHPLIAYMKEIRNTYGISYDAISSLAYTLEIHSGNIRLQQGFDMSRMQDNTDLTRIDPRWTKAILTRYLTLLNDFYKKSWFRKFFESNQSLYATAKERMDLLLQKVDTQWFEEFFGEPFGSSDIYISLTNGSSNYALFHAVDDSRHGILIGCSADRNGDPDFNFITFRSTLHEFLHRFCNPLGEKYRPQMEPAATSIIPHIEKLLAKGGYGPVYFGSEWLTRLAVLMYLRDHSPEQVPSQTAADHRVGFIWQQRAVGFMENFYANRDRYRYFRDYMPQLVGFLGFTAREFEKVVAEFENRRPYVTNVYPAPGTEIDLSMEVVEFRIKFSEPMSMNSDGYWLLGDRLEKLEVTGIPADWKLAGWEDEYTYLVRLKSEWIETGGIYGFVLNKSFTQSRNIYPMAEDFSFTFKIKGK
ncbi:DUF4932 domain-containing protein [uncultured Alistipes sp.]|jgi:hypothetical protein|uniref:DUF4932 domain-containing protein n=1 Tax=uncultured Alistipes sp. TaxID=538949 RepID=UPI0025EC676E|nr:DUF4932 domain-containing protein [uncultured Alistipes sp.]